MTEQLPVTAASKMPMTDCDVSSTQRHELIDQRKRVGATIKAMMEVGAYYDKAVSEVMDAAVLRDWIDRLVDWTPDAIRKAFWVWQDQQPNRRPSPAHILHILRDTHGRKVAEAAKALPRPVEPPRQIVSDEARQRILAQVGGLPAQIIKTVQE